MSFNINFQKTNKESKTLDRLSVRRFWYDNETKKKKSTVIFSVNRYSAPLRLPEERVTKFNVTPEEQNAYMDFVAKMYQEQEPKDVKSKLEALIQQIDELKELLESRTDGATLDLIENCTQSYKALSSQLARHKRNAIKRGEDNLEAKRAKDAGQTSMFDIEVNLD